MSVRRFGLFILWLSTLLGCGKPAEDTLTLQLNWKPEPEFGGFYAADYAAQGLKVEVTPGGAGTPTIQLLGAGKVPFAVVSADEIPKAREQGMKIIGLFAVYQTHPQGLMTQAARGFKSIDDVFKTDGILAIEAGLPYSDFLKNKFGYDKLKVVPSPGGNLSVLRKDPTYTMQCFVTAEPLAAKKEGIDVTVFPIADSGYNPYACVLATTEEYNKAHPETVRKVYNAVKAGWRKYLDDPAATNAAMNKLNPTMDLDTFAAAAEAQKPLIETPETKTLALGCMTVDRWSKLIDQLVALKVITSPVNPTDCYYVP